MVELLRSSFTDIPQLSTCNLYREVAGFLRLLSSKSQAKEEMKCHLDLLTLFWNKFIPECEIIIQQGNESAISKIITFFNILKNPNSNFSLRKEGVKFFDETEAKVQLADCYSVEQDERERIFIENTGMNITPLTFSCHCIFLQERSLAIYELFSVLLSSFPSPSVYTALVHGMGEMKPVNVRELLEQVILPKMEGEDTSTSQATVNIFMSLYDLMDKEDQKIVLLNFKVSFHCFSQQNQILLIVIKSIVKVVL